MYVFAFELGRLRDKYRTLVKWHTY